MANLNALIFQFKVTLLGIEQRYSPKFGQV